MMAVILLFRGRNTDGIRADAVARGLIDEERDQVVVVCRDDDRMAQPGDITVTQAARHHTSGEVTLIANGGTTAQLVPLLLAAMENAQRVVVHDVQPDGATSMAHETTPCLCGCGEPGHIRLATHDCARRVIW